MDFSKNRPETNKYAGLFRHFADFPFFAVKDLQFCSSFPGLIEFGQKDGL
ncbi:hypothetical protein [Paenibacillus sp. SAFN-117]